MSSVPKKADKHTLSQIFTADALEITVMISYEVFFCEFKCFKYPILALW